jgi:hypothetical protein
MHVEVLHVHTMVLYAETAMYYFYNIVQYTVLLHVARVITVPAVCSY